MGRTFTAGLAALAAVLWGANFNLSKPVLADMHPLTAAAARFLIAALVMAAVALASGARPPFRRHGRAYFLLGLVGIGGFNLMFFYGMQSTSAVNGALIMATNPLVTALLAVPLLGEQPSRRHMMALPVALAGVSAVLLGGGAGLALAPGDALMLGANLAWALYNVLVRRLMPPGSGIANTAGVMVMGALVLSAAAVAAGAPVTLPGPTAAAALAAMAIGGTVLAYLFYNAGIKALGAGRTALFLNLVPVSAMAIAAIGGAPPTALQLTGGAITTLAVLGAMMPARKSPLPA